MLRESPCGREALSLIENLSELSLLCHGNRAPGLLSCLNIWQHINKYVTAFLSGKKKKMSGPAPFRQSGVLHTGASIHSAGTLRPGFPPLERQGAGAWEVFVLCRRPTGVSTRLSEGHLSPGLGPRRLCIPLTLSLLPWGLGLSPDPLFSAILESRRLHRALRKWPSLRIPESFCGFSPSCCPLSPGDGGRAESTSPGHEDIYPACSPLQPDFTPHLGP